MYITTLRNSLQDSDHHKDSAHLLAKQDNQCGVPRPNWDAAHLVRSKEKKMEVDWPRKQNATDIYSKSSHSLDPRRKQEEGRPKETWRRSVEREMKALGWSWGQVAKLAADRPRWRSSVSALCASTHEED